MRADLLIFNGKCLSFEDETIYDWLAVSGERILSMGFSDSYHLELSGWETSIDARGGSVLPGFYDSCVHLMQTAFNEERVCLRDASSFEEIGRLIEREAAKGQDTPIIGYALDELKLKEGRLPDRHVLDRYVSDRPVWLSRVEYHTSVLNTYALLHYKIPYTIPGIELDNRKMPTGVFRYNANAKLREDILDDVSVAYRMAAAKKTISRLLGQGITTINSMEGGFTFSDRDAEFVYMYKDSFPIDVVLFYQTTDVEKIKEMGLTQMGGCFADGAFGSRNAALREDYSDMPGARGTLYYSQEEMNELALSCYENNIQLAVNVIGERAIDQLLKAHRYAFERTGKKGMRHRLEHVELADIHHIREAQKLGLIFSVEPAYEYYWGGPGKMYERRLGERYKKTNSFSTMLREGIVMCGGSDSDVTPASPVMGIHMAVNHPVQEHQIDVLSAVKMFTEKGAYAVFEERDKGSLSPGKLADIVILDRDILAVKKEEIKDCAVTCTIKSGNVLYSVEDQEGRMMGILTIRLMGGIHMEKDGQRLDDKLSLKALAMICLLLTSEEKRLRKSRIISLLWPDSDEEASRNNLRYNLWNIKKLVPDENGQELVLSDKNTLSINPAYPVTADILTLKSFRNEKDYSEKELEEFSRLFKGEYLEGFYVKGCMEYSDMILMERITCQNLQIDVLEKLYEGCQAAGNHSRCIEALRELLLIDPYNESFACKMMKHMLGAGHYANTLGFYKKFTANIRKDLNIPPSPELKRLYEQVVQGRYGQTSAEDRNHGRNLERDLGENPADGGALPGDGLLPGDSASLGGGAPPGSGGGTMQVKALCLAGVDYFFMTECLKEIVSMLGNSVEREVEEKVLRDLSFLWIGIAGCDGPDYVPQVRLLDAFHRFLTALVHSRRIDIVIEDRMELDPPSRNFILLLEHRPIDGLSVVSLK